MIVSILGFPFICHIHPRLPKRLLTQNLQQAQTKQRKVCSLQLKDKERSRCTDRIFWLSALCQSNTMNYLPPVSHQRLSGKSRLLLPTDDSRQARVSTFVLCWWCQQRPGREFDSLFPTQQQQVIQSSTPKSSSLLVEADWGCVNLYPCPSVSAPTTFQTREWGQELEERTGERDSYSLHRKV